MFALNAKAKVILKMEQPVIGVFQRLMQLTKQKIRNSQVSFVYSAINYDA